MSDDKALTARDVLVAAKLASYAFLASDGLLAGSIRSNDEAADTALAALDAAGFEITAKGALAEAQGQATKIGRRYDVAIERLATAHNERWAAQTALAEARQRIEAALALHRPTNYPVECCSVCGPHYFWPCPTVRALSSSTAPETGIGAQQWGVNAVSDPEMGSTGTRCHHPYSNPLTGGRTQCRTCGVDTTHVDAMGG